MTDGVARVHEDRAQRTAFEAARSNPAGALTPRQRIDALLDPGSFFEISAMARSQVTSLRDETPGDGVVAGFGTIAGRQVAVIADDAEVLARTDGGVATNKRLRALSHASQGRLPVVYLADGGGTENFALRGAESRLMNRFTDRIFVMPELRLSEREWPLVTALFGACRGQEALLAQASDVVVATPNGSLAAHGTSSAQTADALVESEQGALELIRQFIPSLPEDPSEALPQREPAPPAECLSEAVNAADIGTSAVIRALFDGGSTIPLGGSDDASAFETGFARLDGFPVLYAIGGPSVTGITVAELERLQRVAALRKRFRLPMIGLQHGGFYGADATGDRDFLKAVAACVEGLRDCDAPLLSVITGAGDPLGNFVLGGRELGASYVIAWPDADVATEEMPLFTRDAAEAIRSVGPWPAAGLGIVDDVVLPSETRDRLARVVRLVAPARSYPPPHADKYGRTPFR